MIIRKHKSTPAAIRSTRSSRSRRTLGRVLVLAAAAALNQLWLGVTPALAGRGVKVENVAAGSADISRSGVVTTIRAADRTVINYSSFDVARGEAVRFVQPSASSRVLNRINAKTPSMIDGSIRANGVVYFVNRAGVLFGPNATIESSRFVAAAGAMSDRDFLSGVDRFSLTGPVVNQGAITADTVALVGRTVENVGQITGQTMVTLAAGDAVYMRDVRGEGMMVNVTPHSSDAASAAPSLGVGDAAGVALLNRGSIRSRNINVAGSGGVTKVSGNLDASNAAGTGGQVHLSGERLAVVDARIDASGSTGGGQVYIGGGPRGDGTIPNATNTIVDNRSVIRADATDAGTGGTIIVWADNATAFAGTASARGINQGGFIEVSGSNRLIQNGTYHLGSRDGVSGTLLFDPQDIIITGGTADGSDDPDAADNLLSQSAIGQVLFADVGAAEPFVIFESEIEATDADIILEATSTITVSGAFTGNDVTLQPNRSLRLSTRNESTDAAAAGGNAIVTTGVGFTTSGTGTITITAGATAVTPQTANLVLGPLTTAGAGVTVTTPNGSINLGGAVNAGTGNVTVTAPITSALSIADTVTGGSVDLRGLSVTATAAVSSTNLVVVTGGAFDFNNFSATDSVRIQSGGSVTQTQPINTLNLAVRSTGSVTLNDAANDVNTFAASGTTIGFTDADDLAVGSISAFGGFTPLLSGVSGTTIALSAGSITATSSVVATDLVIISSAGAFNFTTNFAGSNSVRIQASGNVTQSSPIVTSDLGVRSSGGSITLTNASNSVSTFAASASTTVSYTDLTSLTVGTVGASNGFTATTGITGSTHNIATGSGDLAVNGQITASGITRLTAGGTGNITQTAPISSPTLGVRAGGAVTLTNASNAVTTLAGQSGGAFSFRDTNGFTVGNVPASGAFATAATGVLTNGSDILLRGAGNISLSSQVNALGGAGSPGDVGIVNTAGQITQPANAQGIRANILAVSATGNIALDNSIADSNNALTLAAYSTGGSIRYSGARGVNLTFSIGSASSADIAGLPNVTDPLTSASTGTIDGVVVAGNNTISISLLQGNLSLDRRVNANNGAGTGGVNLQNLSNVAQGGLISQPSTTTADPVGITANTLAVRSTGSVTLTRATPGDISINSVTNVAVQSTTSGSIGFRNASGLTLVQVLAANDFLGATGVTTSNQPILLRNDGGTLAVNAALSAGAGGTIRLRSAGDITQTTSGSITAAQLGFIANGAVNLGERNLGLSINSVGTVAGQVTAANQIIGITSQTGTDLVVGSVASAPLFDGVTGLITNSGNVTVVNDLAGLAINSPISAGAGTVRLATGVSGSITQLSAGTITASGLGVISSAGSVTLTDAPNAITTLAGSADGDLSVSNTAGLTVDQIAADDFWSPTQTGVSATDSVRLTATTITANQNVATADLVLVSTNGAFQWTSRYSGTSSVRIQATGNVTQTAAIVTPTLGIRSSGGSITLTDTANDVTTLAASANATMRFVDTGSLTIGEVAALGDFATAATGLSAATADVSLGALAAGTLTVSEAITATDLVLNNITGPLDWTSLMSGTNSVRLQASGNITQSAPITTTTLAARSVAGSVTLTNTANNVATLAGSASTAGQTFRYVDSNVLAVGSVPALGSFASAANGVAAETIRLTAGSLTASQNVAGTNLVIITTAGGFNWTGNFSGTTLVRLQATGDVTQTAPITTGSLGVRSTGGSITLNNAGNDVNSFAATSSTGSISFLDADDLDIVQTAGTGDFALVDGVSVVNSTIFVGAVSGNLSLGAGVDAGSSGTVRLVAGGTVTQTAPVATNVLGIRSIGSSDLSLEANQINVVAADVAGLTLASSNSAGLTVGTVAGTNLFVESTGISSTGGVILVSTLGDLLVANPILASGQAVRLQAGPIAALLADLGPGGTIGGAPSINQSTGALITSNSLAARALGDVILCLEGVNVATVIDIRTGAGRDESVRFLNQQPIFNPAAPEVADSGIFSLTGTGTPSRRARAFAGAYVIGTEGNLPGGTLLIEASGNVSQSAAVTAATVAVDTTGSITLDNAANAFSNYASRSTNSAIVRSSLDITLVTQDAVLCFDSPVTGLRSVNRSVSLRSDGALILNQPITAADDIGLVAGTTITQNGTGIITAGRTLGVRGTTVTLQNASNSVANFTALTSGTLAYTDANAMNIDQLSSDVLPGFIDTAGITAPTVALNVGGALTQTTAGVINANLLGIRSVDATLESENDVVTLAAITTGALSFRDGVEAEVVDELASEIGGGSSSGLDVGSFSAVGSFAAIDGINSNNQNVTLNTTGALTVSEALNAGTGTVRLTAGEGISQSGDGLITALTLGAWADDAIQLVLTNAVENFAGATSSVGGTVRFNSTSDLVIGSVAQQGTMFPGVIGVTTSNADAILASDGSLTLDAAVSVGTAILRLQGGSIAQTVNGIVTAGTLGARSQTSIALELAGVDVGAIDTRASSFDSILLVNRLPVAAVVADESVFDSAVGSPNLRIRRFDGNYVVNGAENIINGTLLIHATGDITQTAELRARNLGLFSGGTITLPNAANNITTLAALAPSGVAVRSSVALTTASQATNRIFQPVTSPVVGISTSNSDITLLAPTLSLTEALSAGTATVRLISGSGGISQTGAITAGALGINTTGPVVLLGNNVIDVISASATSAGLIDLASTNALTVGTITADADSLFTATTGIATAGGGAMLVSSAGISITEAINVGTGIVRLQAGGDIAQSAVITASSVGARTSNGAITLDVANVVDLFAAASASGGLVSIADSNGFEVGTVAARGPFAELAGLTTAGAVVLDAQGANGITQTASITGSRLSITSLGPINLPLLTNAVGTVAFDTTGGSFVVYRNASAFTVGTVAETGLAGITSPAGDVLLASGAGVISISSALNASANTVRIVSPVSITQSGSGVITASVLGVDAPTITLNLNNLITTLGGRATTLSYTNAVGTPLTLGTVPVDPDGFFTAINGTTASTIVLNLGQFTIDQPLVALTSLQIGSSDLVINSNVTTPLLTINHAGNVLLGDAADAAVGTLSNAELARLVVSGLVSVGSTGTVSVNDASIAQAWSGLSFTSAVTMLGDLALTNAGTTLTYNLPVTLGAASTISTNNGAISTAAINGANALSLDAGLAGISLGAIGASTPVSSLSIRSGSLTLNGDVTATGDIAFVPSTGDLLVSNEPLVVGADPVFNITNADLARLTTPGNVILGSGTRDVRFTFADAITFTSKAYTLRVNGAATLASNTAIATGSGGAIFASTVDSGPTPASLTLTGDGQRTFLAAVGATRPLNVFTTGTTTVAVDSVGNVTSIGAQTYGANTVNVNGTLNTTGRLLADGLASILFTGTDVRVNESQTSNAFAVGDLEAIVVPNGSISIFGQTVAVGDISVLNNLTVTSPAITVLRREPISPRQLPVVRNGVGTTLIPGVGSQGVVARDNGMDFVAGGAIAFSSTPTLSGSGPIPVFAVPNPPPGVTPVGTSFIRQAEAVNLLFDARAGNVANGASLDLVASGNSTVDASSAIAAIVDFEAPPVNGPRGVFADLLEVLRRMGISARPALLGELLTQVQSFGRFESFAVTGSTDPRDARASGSTVDRRLLQDAVFSTISATERLGILLTGDNSAEVIASFDQHRSLFEQAVAEYSQANGVTDELTDDQLIELQEQILARPADDATRTSFVGFADLIQRLDQLGLTARELGQAHETLLDAALPQDPALTRSQMLVLLRGR
jgi:filamentous hemagglutinin family protein